MFAEFPDPLVAINRLHVSQHLHVGAPKVVVELALQVLPVQALPDAQGVRHPGEEPDPVICRKTLEVRAPPCPELRQARRLQEHTGNILKPLNLSARGLGSRQKIGLMILQDQDDQRDDNRAPRDRLAGIGNIRKRHLAPISLFRMTGDRLSRRAKGRPHLPLWKVPLRAQRL